MIAREQFVLEARRWIGTPYRHQASMEGAGADCLGLIRGVWRGLLGNEPEQIPAYTEDWSEPTNQELMLEAAFRWLAPISVSSDEIGDVLVFRMRENMVAKHIGITAEVAGRPTFIHSFTDHGVVETHLSLPWRRKIAGRFAFPPGVK